MKLKIEENSSADYISARIKSTILYPKTTKANDKLSRDEEQSRGRERAFWSFYLGSLSDDDVMKIMTPSLVRFLNESDSLDSYNKKWDACKKKIYTVYSLMRLIYSGTYYQGQPMSYLAAVEKYVDRAIHEYVSAPELVESGVFGNETCDELARIPEDRKYKINTSSVKNHWNELREVAHICTAWYSVKPGGAESNSERRVRLLEVLRLASALYDFGTKHVVPKSRGALLDPATTWTLPDSFDSFGLWDDALILLSRSDFEFYSVNCFFLDQMEGLD
ncbi:MULTISPECIES: hypothetical protein [unclassified Pseudodesulfovibrio]|uniref:hypothetical protein n=1 Tax=unclassified Pseudodesulfovibrio TaxID=2661612 RepID=UPI000FEB7B12|nr:MULTISPECIES: hypothetical protein [unclassified Pseudodesulfovibrio]MCJ2164683.1 hypothetical protein [Pseudodesulfovibrio sp. S3-i]RWU04125.1 hypothetical protein DWB63_08960 [Pseudodesulfovibrio sp. S3]